MVFARVGFVEHANRHAFSLSALATKSERLSLFLSILPFNSFLPPGSYRATAASSEKYLSHLTEAASLSPASLPWSEIDFPVRPRCVEPV